MSLVNRELVVSVLRDWLGPEAGEEQRYVKGAHNPLGMLRHKLTGKETRARMPEMSVAPQSVTSALVLPNRVNER